MRVLKDFLKFLWYEIKSMAYFYTPQLELPLEKWRLNSCRFKQRDKYDGKDWGLHLGEDSNTKAGTPVRAIGRGKVVYSALHATKESPKQGGYRNWGNIIIIAHKNPKTKKIFFSLYGHLEGIAVKKGDKVERGQKIGNVASSYSQTNGWWEEIHLHLAIYIGPWKGVVLPGYFRETEKRTKLKWWIEPTKFIRNY